MYLRDNGQDSECVASYPPESKAHATIYGTYGLFHWGKENQLVWGPMPTSAFHRQAMKNLLLPKENGTSQVTPFALV
jgi:hypothetical protein